MTSPANATTDTIRVGIIGYGLSGAVFHAPLVGATPGMSVAAIVTNNPGRQAQARHDYPTATISPTVDAMLADPAKLDLVVVAAPNRAHVPVALAALDAGLPVVVDKPFAPTSDAAARVIATARRGGKLLTVFQNRRWDNDFLTALSLIASDALGPIVRFESRFERYRPAPKPGAWRELPDPEEAGGLLFDLGAHLIDQALRLFGPPATVYAESDARRADAQIDDDTFVALRFPGGQVAHLWMSVVPHLSGPRFRIVGLRGVYEKHELDPQEDALRVGARPGDEGWGLEPRERWGHLVADRSGITFDGAVETLPGRYEAYYAGVRDALRAGGSPPVDPDDSLAGLRVIEAARASARTGQVVRLS